jgi:hypothetical protein
MQAEFKISESHQKLIKNEAIKAIILVSFLLIVIPPIIYMNYWYFSIIIGIVSAPIWIKYRWSNYKKEILNIKNHTMVVYDNSMQFNNKKSKYEIDITQLKKLNINLKKSKISSITITIDDDINFSLSGYENMGIIEKHLKSHVSERNIKYHRWFHKY